ncbi:alpha-1,2-mannosidase [Volvox carteri f. nagariensis]|uniref:alpha-1,2-Mannosidase n=1 Tax=Volvox carteri f. nagariensis TaxID=3068 RepID=D8UG85_VOLCA|nr:alpha-1,2-mannosidase [Volvox carteri f. nagariensis]EFJ41245.1 alpha-1,2-mannosidase [Volvox carteri f. nagariensis]|eukprot:XP_002957696.1 alpha-1,2-mannosidase [Volvox carteri f. nagariensis]
MLTSQKYIQSGICDGNYTCGVDGLGCITDALLRKEKVREAARWTWKGYRQYAWGHDELNAGSRTSREWFALGLTIVDSLDTLQILGLLEEYAEARFWVANHLNFNQGEVSVFETTIRILGGLVAAFYHSGGDELFLLKAVEFAESVHDTEEPRGKFGIGSTCLAEVATVSMEFSAVSRLSGRPEFRDTAMIPWQKLTSMQDLDGLYCTFLNGDSLGCSGNHYTMGASADSAYEYMLKQWIMNKNDSMCIDMYKKAIGGMRKHMLTQLWMGEDIGDVWIVAENDGGRTRSNILEHLTCFLPGTIALGHMYGINTASSPDEDDDLTVAVKLMKACYELYHQTATGVAFDSVLLVPRYSPEPVVDKGIGQFQTGTTFTAGSTATGNGNQQESSGKGRILLQDGGSAGKTKYAFAPRSRENFLRPEVAESLFYLWRATGDPIYREWGWNMFRAYERWCRVSTGGYQVLNNVDTVPPSVGNKMESFWMAETMKYFYLLFSDDPDEIPLDEFVFNTEAHPLAIWGTETDLTLREVLANAHGRLEASGVNALGKSAQYYQSNLMGMTAAERHKKFVNDYLTYYACGRDEPSTKNDAARIRTDADALREHHRFIRSDADNESSSWEARLAKRYYDRLFKEYAIVDLTYYKQSKLGMRWRTQKEVVSGKGQFVCGAKGCDAGEGLCSYEVNFAYQEAGERKQALVKLRLCPACAFKLNYRKEKQLQKAADAAAARKRKREQELEERMPNDPLVQEALEYVQRYAHGGSDEAGPFNPEAGIGTADFERATGDVAPPPAATAARAGGSGVAIDALGGTGTEGAQRAPAVITLPADNSVWELKPAQETVNVEEEMDAYFEGLFL